MRLRQIEIFYHVYRTGSISGAARDLNVSQPSVSKVLRHAEDQLGFALFMRRKGRIYPTPEADELFVEAKDIYGRISAFNRTADNIRSRQGGHIRLGALPSVSLSLLPDALAKFRVENANVSFELTTIHSDQIIPALIEKRCDICVGFEAPSDERIATTRLGAGQLVVVSNRELETGADGLDPAILHDIDFIGIKDSGPLWSLLSSLLEDRGIKPKEVVTTRTYHVALALVRKGVGLAVVDEFTANSYLGPDLFRYPLVGLESFPIFAATLTQHYYSDLLEDCISGLSDLISG